MSDRPHVAVIGGGPAGLMAAEVLSEHDISVSVYDAMPSLARKFLMAGKSGLNISRNEPIDAFTARYLRRDPRLDQALRDFGPMDVAVWMRGLGIAVHQGSSRRLFPVQMKASPLLRAWLGRLAQAGVSFHLKTRWVGWADNGSLLFETPEGTMSVNADATILALGGGSWRRLGSDGRWADMLRGQGVTTSSFEPSNGGFLVAWSDVMKERFAGSPVKATVLSTANGVVSQGEWVVTKSGMEGGGVYDVSQDLRDEIAQRGSACLTIDLLPTRSEDEVVQRLQRPRGTQSMSNHLRKKLGLTGVKAALLRECASPSVFNQPDLLANCIKALPLTINATAPIDAAISTAGGVPWAELNEDFMLHQCPGLYCAGEMIDWDAPTGGYLLTGCLALGRAVGRRAQLSLVQHGP